jgi:two-component sensor histidine kinase
MDRSDVVRSIYRIRSHPRLAIGLSVLALLASFFLRYSTPIPLAYVPFYPAILLATVVAGPLVAIGVTIISAGLALVFFTLSLNLFALTSDDIWSLGAFLTVSLLTIGTTDFLLKTVIQSQEQADRLIAADKHTRVLLRELSHRMKNQYAVILAMARATARTATSVPEFQHTFTHRLHSLSRTHDHLVASDWKSVPIKDLIAIEMEAASTKGPLSLQGLPLNLTPIAAVNLGMALHELITNAVRHGAWVSNAGNVSISWKCDSSDFFFHWHEKDEPALEELGPKGFGLKILEHVVPIALGGSSELLIRDNGLHWYLKTPIDGIVISDPSRAM